jgi:hypothetical protein
MQANQKVKNGAGFVGGNETNVRKFNVNKGIDV